MSELSKLQGKSKTYKVGEIEVNLKPLAVDDLDLVTIDSTASIEDQAKTAKRLVSKVLKNSIPDATDEEIANISLEHMEELMKAIMDLHNLKDTAKGQLQKRMDMIKNAKVRQNQTESPK